MTRKFRRVIALMLSVVMCLSMVHVTTVKSNAASTITVSIDATYGQTAARSMLEYINDFRTGDDAWYWNSTDTEKVTVSGLSELTYDYDLEAIAMQRAAEIALSFSHTRPDNSGYIYPYLTTLGWTYSTAGENIAAGYTTAYAAFVGWCEEDDDYSGQGHRRNMLNSDYTRIGIGHVYYNGYHYWVQVLGTPDSKNTYTNTATEANDSTTTVSIDVATSLISSSSITATSKSVSMEMDSTADVPTVTTKILMSSTWPSRLVTVNADVTWASSDESVVSISGDTITGESVGTATLTGTFLSSTADVSVTVTEKDISDYTATLSCTSYTYWNYAWEPTVTVTDASGNELTEDTDFEVEYANNINAGTATATITGIGNYKGTIAKEFTIEKQDIADHVFELYDGETFIKYADSDSNMNDDFSYVYDGTAKTPSVYMYNWLGTEEEFLANTTPSVTLEEGVDFKVEYSNNINAGTAYVTVTATSDNYTGTRTGYFYIEANPLEEDMVTLSFQETGYTGEAQNPTATVVDGQNTLVLDKDYTVTYEANTEIGTYTVTVEGTGNYQGKIAKTFEITKGDTGLTYNVASCLLIDETTAITANAKTDITFASSDETVITVDQDGLITAVGVGTATITITAAETEYYKGATATVDIEVVEEIPTTEEPTTEEPTTEEPTTEEPTTEESTTETPTTEGASSQTSSTTEGETPTDSSAPTTTTTLTEGTEVASGGAVYKVTTGSDGTPTVTLTSVASTTIKKVTIDTVTVDGVTYKVTAIADKAFKNCTKLTSVTIGSSVKTIGSYAFYGCTSLKTVSISSAVTTIGKYAFAGCTKLTTVKGMKKVTTIKAYAFYGCKKLTTIGSKKNVITLPKVKNIGKFAFAKCTAITKVNITSSVLTSIDNSAFKKCTKLKTFSASSKKLKKLGTYVFAGDKKLATVTFKTSKLKSSNVGKGAFSNIKKTCTFKVPKAKIKAYKKIFKARGASSKIKVKKS